MSGWLSAPVQLHSSRMFDCDGFTEDQCAYYQNRWHFWYIADHIYALPTIAFFVCVIGIFVIGYWISTLRQIFGYHRDSRLPGWCKAIAAIRFLSYRGFRVDSLRWNSAPVGVLLIGAIAVVFFFCMTLIPQPYYWPSLDFGGSPPLGTRSGWMALACMPFVFATASKTSWITLVTGVSYERLQVWHRWISYAFFLLALMHTFPFIVYHIRFHDMTQQVTQDSTVFYWTGIVALIFQAWLTFASHSTIRNLGYEFFKAAHFAAVVVFVLIFFWHCDYTLSSWDYFIATAAVYVPCLVYSWLRTFFEYGLRRKARLCIEGNEFTRITIPANLVWGIGSHCFLRFTGFGAHTLTSHPFTICSLPSTSRNEPSELTFYLRHQGGFTSKLYDHASKHPDSRISVLVDGPYGGIDVQKFNTSERLLVVAGGSGAGWTLPFIEQFVRQGSSSTDDEEHGCNTCVAAGGSQSAEEKNLLRRHSRPLSLHVILATRDANTRTWFCRIVSELLSKYPHSDLSENIRVEVFLTGDAESSVATAEPIVEPNLSKSIPSLSSSSSSSSSSSEENEKMNRTSKVKEIISKDRLVGRPPLPQIVKRHASTAAETSQSLAVFVCGPSTMLHDVRNAVAEENLNILKGDSSCGVYLHTEHFSWA